MDSKSSIKNALSKPKTLPPPREVQLIPNPSLVITQSLSGSYLKLLEVANALKLHRVLDQHYLFRNQDVEIELLQLVAEKVYQLRVHSPNNENGMVDEKSSVTISKILSRTTF